MATGTTDQSQAIEAYYEYLRDTCDVARTLVERSIWLEDPNLASGANLLRMQLQSMLDNLIEQQQASMPLPTLDS